MTIALGFRCVDGIMLCADTQETYDNYIKRKQPKLTVKGTTDFPFGMDVDRTHEPSPCAVFAGAGNDADFLDALIDKLWTAMERKGREGIDAMVEACENELIEQYGKFVPLYPSGVPETTLLVGIWSAVNDYELVKISGPVLKRQIMLDTIGCGDLLATYITQRFVKPKSWLSISVPVGLYVIDQVKKHVEGCGADTQLIVIRSTGRVESYTPQDAEQETDRLRKIDAVAREMFGLTADYRGSDEEYNQLLAQATGRLRLLRQH
ncbi:MAG TPA: hypothetical protein VKV05_00995 [Terriglobales bacterium]|nr:hypothetical protein [Terriglobales bacterium]